MFYISITLFLLLLLSLDITSFSLSALHLTSLLPFPLLVTARMCHRFYHFGGSCLLKRNEEISRVPKPCQDASLPPSTKHLHLLIPKWMAPLIQSTARALGHMTLQTTPPRHGHEASKHINEGRKGEEEAQPDQT